MCFSGIEILFNFIIDLSYMLTVSSKSTCYIGLNVRMVVTKGVTSSLTFKTLQNIMEIS